MVARDQGDEPRPSTSPAAGVYEDLSGGVGRQVFFRPDRYGADELGPVAPFVRVTVDAGETFECRVLDVSQNGLAFRWERPCEPPKIGAVLSRLCVTFDGYAAYEGSARVSSVRGSRDERLVAVAFLDSLMDIDDVLRLRDVRAWESRRAPRLGFEGKPWRVAGHEEFKALVGELRMFLDDAQGEFDALEKSFPSHLFYRDVESAARAGLLQLIQTQFVHPFVEHAARIDAALRGAGPADWQALREFSLRQVHAQITRSRSLSRALHKPFGYPGDFLVIESIYDKGFEGPTLFDRAVEHAILSLPAAAAVRARKDLLRETLRERICGANRGTTPLRIVSVASGPAREVAELLSSLDECPRDVEITLFDQDKSALSYAYSRIRRIVDERFADRVRVHYLHDSIRRLLHDPEIFSSLGPFDMALCSGLFDYLSLPTAVRLAKKLYANLAEGGGAWIGNMRPINPTRWAMEHHMDWHLIYRTDPELHEMGQKAAPDAAISIADDATGVNPFLVLERT